MPPQSYVAESSTGHRAWLGARKALEWLAARARFSTLKTAQFKPMTNPDEKPAKEFQQSEDMDDEISSDELRDFVGGVLEITTTDDQTIRWNVDGQDTLSYNHLDGSTRTVKVAKIRRLKK
jgi:hypothetical protein